MNLKHFIIALFGVGLFSMTSCVENDLPFPTIHGMIEEIVIEGQTSVKIDNASAKISIIVADTCDLRKLRVEKLMVTEGMTIIPDSAACFDFMNFPDSGFVSVDSLPASANTYMNFKRPVSFLLRLYQDYPWQITVDRDIKRSVTMANQLGASLIDAKNRNVIVYVDSVRQPSLRDVQILDLRLGSSVATTTPNPATVTDFTRPRIFRVEAFDEVEDWTVSVAYPPAGMSFTTVSPWAKRAYVVGKTLTGQVSARYRVKAAVETKADDDIPWEEALPSEITIDAEGNFTLIFTHLKPGTTYEYILTVDGVSEDTKTFTTEEMPTIPNLSMDDWYKDGKSWYPNLDMSEENYFWDSGNKGSNAVGEANPTSPETSDVVKGKAARLESKTVAGVFAAGSFYSGTFGKVEGLNGASLNFGRPYTGRPSALRGYYKYNSGIIDKARDPYKDLIGVPDTSHIIVALFKDWTSPYLINTNTGELLDFSWNNEDMIGYGILKEGSTIKNYTPFRIDIEYRDMTTKPTYIVILAAASKLGDYFTGSTSSVLLVDELELLFE